MSTFILLVVLEILIFLMSGMVTALLIPPYYRNISDEIVEKYWNKAGAPVCLGLQLCLLIGICWANFHRG